jgi:hypothetical protein
LRREDGDKLILSYGISSKKGGLMSSPVALEELLVSSLAQTDALAKPLIEKDVSRSNGRNIRTC